jgi:hypothetical protein
LMAAERQVDYKQDEPDNSPGQRGQLRVWVTNTR